MGETEDQIKICKSILALDKTNYTALINLGALSFTTKNYQTCKTVYAILLTAYPEDLAAISGYAWSLVYLGDNSKALPYFTKLVVMSPDYSFAQKGYELCGGK
jgi:tetratricopeptide (TPR) repeat protein